MPTSDNTASGPGIDEYLEGVFERSFDREGVQEEHVVSSLPFFIAALALTVTVLGFIVEKLPAFSPSLYSVATYALVGLSGLSMAGVLPFLVIAMRPRVFRLPPRETDFHTWALSLRDYYFAQGLRGGALQATVVKELREAMLNEFAQAAVHNRAHNASRKSARTQGITLIILALTFSFLVVGTIFVHDRVLTKPNAGSVRHVTPAAATTAAASKTLPAALAANCRGGQVSGCQAVGTGRQVTSSRTPKAGPTQTPAQPQQNQRPIAPPPQYVKKNDPGQAPRR